MSLLGTPLDEPATLLSCLPGELYSEGGFYDSEVTVERLEQNFRALGGIARLGRVSEKYTASRQRPHMLLGPDPAFVEQTIRFFEETAGRFCVLCPSILVQIEQAVVWNNMLFAVRGGQLVPIYETYRPCDRSEKGRNVASRALEAAARGMVRPAGDSFVFFGSAGSFNYGHWLVDEFCSLDALQLLPPTPKLTIVLTQMNPEIDRVKADTIAAAIAKTEVMFVDRDEVHVFEKLYYVTPITYHPFLKNPERLEAGKRLCRSIAGQSDNARHGSTRLFVNRSAGFYRRIVNSEETRELLAKYGYDEIFPEELSFQDQWALFSRATHIAGVMGAAMTNTMFCRAGVPLLYMAPDRWIEPFYWDLAEMCGHSYSAIYGPPIPDSEHDYRRSFAVSLPLLEQWLKSVHETSAPTCNPQKIASNAPVEEGQDTMSVATPAAIPIVADYQHRGMPYESLLTFVHDVLKPKSYIEIGACFGTSLQIAKCRTLAVDPQFQISTDIIGGKPQLHLFQMGSDAFFKEFDPKSFLGRPIDFAFLDGMHLFEFLLRDFINTEKHCSRNSIIAMHDCLPVDLIMTDRNAATRKVEESQFPGWWTGDVWKMIPILRTLRPDLKMICLDAYPTGIVMCTNLAPESLVLEDNYFSLLETWRDVHIRDYGLTRLLEEAGIISTNSVMSFENASGHFWL